MKDLDERKGMRRFLRAIFPDCPKDDGGKLKSTMLDMEIDRLVYECDVCKTEFV